MEENKSDSDQPQKSSSARISSYIKFSLQKSLSDLTKPYSKPISSILPEEREVEKILLFDDVDLDSHYERLKGWEGSISKRKIRDWLEQFDTTIEKNIAHLLLSKFQFFSIDRIEAATRSLQAKLFDLLIEKEGLHAAFNSAPNPPEKTDTNFRRWLRNNIIRYARFPSPPNTSVESQDRLWGVYERSALTSTSSPDGKKLRPLKEYFEASSGKPENSVFVFMDYTNASGNQFTKCIREIHKLLTKYPAWQNCFFVFMYVVQSKSFRLDSIDLVPDKSDTIFFEEILD